MPSARRTIVAAVVLSAGGAAILASATVDYMSNFWGYIAVQGIGFTLVGLGSGLTRPSFRGSAAWALLLSGSIGWFICWSWFLSFGLLIPVPLVLFATVATVSYLVATFMAGSGADQALAAVTGVLALGAAISTGIMAAHPVFASDFNYVPFGVGALLGGVVYAVVGARRSADGVGSPGRPTY